MKANPQTQSAPFYAVSGPSGSGKTSVCRKIAEEMGWYYSVSHTTRPQRPSEINGRDYFFVTEAEFLKLSEEGEFLEWAKVYDNYYGTSRKIIQKKLAEGCGVIVDVDTQGASNIRRMIPNSVLIFIKTQELNDLRSRLQERGRDTDSEIEKRMSKAQSEINHIPEYDHVIVNDNFEHALDQIRSIIKANQDKGFHTS